MSPLRRSTFENVPWVAFDGRSLVAYRYRPFVLIQTAWVLASARLAHGDVGDLFIQPGVDDSDRVGPELRDVDVLPVAGWPSGGAAGRRPESA